MATAAAPAAAARTLALPEMLENILVFADPIQLFALQRVSTIFKDTITRSEHIRKRMLLDPMHVPDIEEARKIFSDGRIQRAIYPFSFEKLFDETEQAWVLGLHIEDKFVQDNQDLEFDNIEWNHEDHPLLTGPQSWSRIRFTSPWGNNVVVSLCHPDPEFLKKHRGTPYYGCTKDYQGMDLHTVVWQAAGISEAYWAQDWFKQYRAKQLASQKSATKKSAQGVSTT